MKKRNLISIILLLLIVSYFVCNTAYAAAPIDTTGIVTKEADVTVDRDDVRKAAIVEDAFTIDTVLPATQTVTSIVIGPVAKTITEALRKTLRKGAVAYMYQMATIKWTPKKSFRHWSSNRTYNAGTTYYGIPYSQRNRDNGLEEFEKSLKKGKYTGPTAADDYIGNDCSSAVSQAYSFVLTNINKFDTRYTGTLVPGSPLIKKVGDYSYKSNTFKSTRSNGKSKMVKAYRKLQAGDLVVVTGVSNPHTMMVSGTRKDGVFVIHQTTYDAKLKSTWRVNEFISFNELYSKGYVPVTLYIF